MKHQLAIKNIDLITALNSNPERQGSIELVILLLSVYNCRVSEILSCKRSDLFVDRFLIIRAKKHSQDYVVRDREILKSISKLPKIDSELIFFPLTYQVIYNYIKRNYSHLFDKTINKKNEKITHYFRYKNAEYLNTTDDVQLLLHHKSNSSAKYYNKNLKS